MKKVTVTRRGGGKKAKGPKDHAIEDDGLPLEAICDNPEMLRRRHVPNPMRYSWRFFLPVAKYLLVLEIRSIYRIGL